MPAEPPSAAGSDRAPATLGELLERAARHPDRGLRLLDRRERPSWASWAEIGHAARGVAGRLRALGVGRGERVALVYPTGLGFFHAFFGILMAGAVPVPLYPPARLGRFDDYHRRTAAMLAAAGARLVLADGRLGPRLEPAVAAARPPLGCLGLEELPQAAPVAGAPRLVADELALVQFSSGTTVDPKPAALSHRALLAQVRALNALWPDPPPPAGADPGRGEVERHALERHSGVSWLPLYHDMGLIGCVLPALERPGDLTLLAPEVFVARPAAWLRALSRYRGTLSAAPDFAYALCVEKIRDDELEGVDLSDWRFALDGAEPISPATLRAFAERFARWGFHAPALTPVYGLSEASLAVTFSALGEPFRGVRFDRGSLARGEARPDPAGVELASVGRPLPGGEVLVVDRAGRPLADGRVGRVWARGPWLMSGYLGRPAATAAALPGGWLDTGDLGFLRGGELYLTGRAKDLVILRGRNYAPGEIEAAAATTPGVRRNGVAAVSHRPEGAAGERLIVFVERRRGLADGEAAALAGACAEAVLGAVGLRPDAVVVLDPGDLPRTSSGKLRRREALRRHLAGELAAPPAPPPVGAGLSPARPQPEPADA